MLVKGGTVGTTTDGDGRFSLTIPAGSPLEVSFLGYARQEIATAGRTSLDIRLEEDAATLDEVVVVGYGTMKRRNLVGAVDQVDSRVIGDRSNGNLARSLQGELPGLNISFSDSKPSRSASFNVRGETSIGAGGNALVLIDGVEGSMDAINPQDVESVSVLKDASSTAVYGARGAFGVVLVTTKSPKRGAPEINYNGSVTFNRRTVIPDVITDGLTWVNWWKDSYNGYYNGSKSLLSHIDSTVPYSEAIYQELIRRQADPSLSRTTTLEGDSMFGWAYMESTDWLDLFYKDWNLSHEHNLSISGGNENADYYVSGRFYDMDGIYRVGDEKSCQMIRPACQGFGATSATWLDGGRTTPTSCAASTDQHEPEHYAQQPRRCSARPRTQAAMPAHPVTNPDGSWTAAAVHFGLRRLRRRATSYRDNDSCSTCRNTTRRPTIDLDQGGAESGQGRLLLHCSTTRARIDVQISQVTYSERSPGVQICSNPASRLGASPPQRGLRHALPGGQRLPDSYTPNAAARRPLDLNGAWPAGISRIRSTRRSPFRARVSSRPTSPRSR